MGHRGMTSVYRRISSSMGMPKRLKAASPASERRISQSGRRSWKSDRVERSQPSMRLPACMIGSLSIFDDLLKHMDNVVRRHRLLEDPHAGQERFLDLGAALRVSREEED